MGPETVNRNKDSNFYGPYAGCDLYITMLEDKEREFVVTHNANIKPVSYFTGRETELQELRQRVEEGRKSVLVSGMGGIGKTHICRKLFEEYLTKHVDDGDEPFRHIGYIEYSGDMGSSLQNCLKYKQQDRPEANQEAAWRELEYLASDGKLLLFVDNVNRPMREDIGLQRLNSIPGAVVLTSRQTSFSDEFEPYRIGFLSTEQCKEIYEKIRFEGSGGKVKPEEEQDLIYIIETLAGRHTITVEFLAHLARTKLWTVKRLRDELEQKGFRLQFRKNGELINIQEEYEKLYDLSKLTEAEQNILEAFSVFPYIPLPAVTCNQWLLPDARVSEDDDILIGLYQKGWLQFEIEQECYSLHPVFAQFIYEKCRPIVENHSGLVIFCRACLMISDSGEVMIGHNFIPYVESIIIKMYIEKSMEQVELISEYAYWLNYIAEYEKAEGWYKIALNILKDIGEENDYLTSVLYNNLAGVYENQGDYRNAEIFNQKSLEILNSLPENNLLSIATSYNNLAGLYADQGEYSKAEEFYVKALEIQINLDGENHPFIAKCYNNLARLYEIIGDYEKAEKFLEKSIMILKSLSETNLVDLAISYNYLAQIYMHRMEYKKAEKMCLDGLNIREKILREFHPDTATSYVVLARIYKEQGDYVRAEELYKKSIMIWERIHGDCNPDAVTSYGSLADMYSDQKKYDKAKELYEKCIWIYRHVFGENNSKTARYYNQLACAYMECREYDIALSYFCKAYKIVVSKLGLNHPSTQIIYKNLEMAYSKWNPGGNFKQWLEKKLKEEE